MKRTLVLIAAVLTLVLAPAGSAHAISCPTGHVVWLKAYNSSDGTYKRVYWQGGNQYFPGSGTDYVNTGSQTNSFATVDSNSSTKWVSEFCVPEDVEFT